MVKSQSVYYWHRLVGLLSTLLIMGGEALAQPVVHPEFLIGLEFPPSSNANPTSTAGGSTRGNCLEKEKELTFLGPGNHPLTTATASPSFFFYVPIQAEFIGKVTGEFELKDHAQTVVTSSVTHLDQAGILQVKLPATTQLQSNQKYTWVFTLICDPTDQGVNKWLEGTIERTVLNPELAAKLETATLLEKAELYAKALIWTDTLEIAATLRQQDQQPWQELLTSVGLESLVEIPLIPTEQ